MDISEVAGKDAPTVVNERGGGQSDIKTRFDLIDSKAIFAMARVLDEGAKKYGENNWRKIDVKDHLNHLIMHVYAYLDGDRSDDHLAHIMCRAMFAQGVAYNEPTSTEVKKTVMRKHWRDISEADHHKMVKMFDHRPQFMGVGQIYYPSQGTVGFYHRPSNEFISIDKVSFVEFFDKE